VAEPEFDEQDRAALLATIDGALSDKWDPARAEDPNAVWAQLLDLGITELIAPAASGAGMGLPVTVLVDVVRTASRHLAPGPLLEEAFLRPWLAGEGWVLSRGPGLQLALADSAATFDWRSSRGEIHYDTAEDTLSGTVHGVANAPAATTLIVIATHGEAADRDTEAIYAVDATTPGVTVHAAAALDPGCPIGTVTLDGVAAGPAPIVSNPDAIAQLRAWLQVLVAAELLGIAEATVELTRTHALQRQQFGRPIAGFQVIRHILADMASRSIAMGNLVERTASEMAGMAHADRTEAAAAVKAHVAGATLQICEQALQVHGGIGFVEEHPLHRYFKATLRRHGLYGTPAELYQRIGTSVLSARA
jgi:alkylation response protein AidB-like acyl-CoA dehydrogenase